MVGKATAAHLRASGEDKGLALRTKEDFLLSCAIGGKVIPITRLRKFICNLIPVSSWAPSVTVLLLWGF